MKRYSLRALPLLVGIAALSAYLLVLALVGCPVKFLTGISCPCCGMTRAYLSALRLDVVTAFTYHPMWIFLPPIIFLLIFFRLRHMKKAFIICLTAGIAAMLAVYVLRLVLSDGGIVSFSPREGLLYSIFQRLVHSP